MGQTRTKVIETAIEPEKQKKIEVLEKNLPAGRQGQTVAIETKEKKKKIRPQKVRSSRYKQSLSLIDKSKEYSLGEAIDVIQKTATTKFDGSVEAHINLGLSADKQEHQIRTSIILPHPTSPKASRGKSIKILVFTDKNKEAIKKLGAEVGSEATLKEIEAGKVGFGKIIADPTWMPRLAKVAKILGPKGLMPNPKSGTTTDDPASALKEFSKGKMELRTEKYPIIHAQIGKSSFTPKQLQENLQAVISAVTTARPEGFKKGLIKSVYLSSTMGPSVKVVPASIGQA